MNIPLLDLKAEYEVLKKDIDAQIKDCLDSQHWILGAKVSEFEEKAARYLETEYAIGVASGTDALVVSLGALALSIKGKDRFDKKDEIITTPFTFVATAEAIARSGATPVFVDIDPDTYNICPLEIAKAITENTVGIIPVHLYGLACNMGEICKLAQKHKLFVLEDTAQAFGASYRGKKLGTIGDIGSFSFFPSKNLGCFGDGGLITTNNEKYAELIRALRNHGQVKKYNAEFLGYNSRLDSLQAAILLAKLNYLDEFNELRRKVAAGYNRAFKSISEITTPIEPKGSFHVHHLYTMKVSSRRDELLKFLNSRGIASRPYYPLALYEMDAFKDSISQGSLTVTKEALATVLSLPIYPFLKDNQFQYITKTVSSFFSK